ncbi:MAG: SDR family oxidoreductase [Gemmatimonadaceae bacterium]|jgi:acetoacetyl-CoA reductase/3-oxoacyl-[acyl-carrier protein] reductase|nr:SDR family oxidoreductase [Gemmatimonadaceae bacterium]
MTTCDETGRLDGQVAVVAGGAGAIGEAIADRLASNGARVFSLDVRGAADRPGVTSLVCDLSRSDDVNAAMDRIDTEAGRIDIVVHAAGVVRDARLWKLTDDDWRAVMSTNLDSAFYLLRSATPRLRRAGGSVVLISSINGERGKVGQAAYAASKAGLNALAKTAARELGSFGIRVNVVSPGWIETPMTVALPDDVRERARQDSALGRLGEPDDVARVVMFLAGSLARHVTGQILRVDGGQLIG